MRAAVLGHVEWVDFVRVARVPAAGEIVHGEARLAVAAGGGAVAAVAMARWAGASDFYTALGDDERGRGAAAELRGRGVSVHAEHRGTQRRAVTMVDDAGERTIVVIGERLVARGADPLPWGELADVDAVYITGGDVEAVRAARRARVVVATSRIQPLLREAGIALDAVVGSAADELERYEGGLATRLVVRTDGARGGTYEVDGVVARYAAVPAEVTGDTYGAGDTFAAALAFALGEGKAPAEACAWAAARAAEVVAFTGPYPPQPAIARSV